MEAKKINEQYVKILSGMGYKLEKQEFIIRAIMEDQIKFLNACKTKWGEDFYNELMPNC